MIMTKVNSSKNEWISLPYTVSDNDGDIDYLYVVGGYHSIGSGTAVWGTVRYNNIRLIGDQMGDLVITYENGTEDRVPLVFGYTLWYYKNWKIHKAPFDGPGKDKNMASLLEETLHLYGAFEGKEDCVLSKVKGRKG